MSWDQNVRRSHNIETDNCSFERVEEFKYLWTTLTNQNFVQEEIKSRSKSGSTWYHSMQNLFSFSLLSKNIKIKIYRTIILPVVLRGCETWSLTLREKCRLRVFENRVLRRILVNGEWRKLHNEELYDLHSSLNIIWVIKSRRMRWVEHVTRMGERWDVYRVLVGNLRKRPRCRWEDNIKIDLACCRLGGHGLNWASSG